MSKIKIEYFEPIVNWPDKQSRIMKNIPQIIWEGRVHERLIGWKNISNFPDDHENWALIHHKTIDKQTQQNKLYNTI